MEVRWGAYKFTMYYLYLYGRGLDKCVLVMIFLEVC